MQLQVLTMTNKQNANMHKYKPMSVQKCNMDLQVTTMSKKQNAA